MEPGQRSRKGCLTCRQKRKKCDEVKPVCGRCRDSDDCVWPASKATSRPRLPRIQPRLSLDPKPVDNPTPLAGTSTPISVSGENKTSNLCSYELNTGSLDMIAGFAIPSNPCSFTLSPPADFAPSTLNTSDLPLGIFLPASVSGTFGIRENPLGSGYRLLPPPALNTCVDEDGPEHFLDDDEEEVFKPTEWLPGTSRLLSLHLFLELSNQERVQWSSALDSYLTFYIRYSYDSSNLLAQTSDLVAYHVQLESVRLAVLGTSLLFYSFLNPGFPQTFLRKYAIEIIDAAAVALQLEESQPNMSLDAQLAGVSGILIFYYFIGDLGSYMKYIDRALPTIQQLVGAAPVSIHKLHGPETLDIRIFAWCDIFSAIATSCPARLVYDCNVDALLQRNQEGPSIPLSDSGLEWMSGLPDALLLLIIQIINLKHVPISQTERTAQAATIEAALRGWKVWPSGITNSVMRVQRVSAQEIWRHFTILYLYQAIHKATPSQEVVQQSVKQIIKLASTLRPGHNPDCLLYVPYFLAGTFVVSVKDRRFIRDRLMRCGIDTYMKKLVDALEQLWGQQLPVDKHVDWTSRTPPLVML